MSSGAGSVHVLWYGKSLAARAARTAMSPASWLYGAGVAARNAIYDRGALRSRTGPIPVVSVGNLTVGGTGKTPFTAYLVRELIASGHRPAVVMRGYGDDELHLHTRINPGVTVVTGADRVVGIQSAAELGADVVVLDDGFQHRRAARDLDIVLVSADQWGSRLRLLPAGPLREPLKSLRRAGMIAVTRKSATDAEVAVTVDALDVIVAGGTSPARPMLIVATMAPDALVSARDGRRLALTAMRGERVLAFAGIGDPASFFAQLAQQGAVVTERHFRDHHAYSRADVEQVAAESTGHKYVVATEKDVVKLTDIWPANGPELWYLSQAVRITEGQPLVAPALAKLFQRAPSIAR